MLSPQEPFTILLFGRSGAGKGTQAKLLKEFLEKRKRHVVNVETGELLREAAAMDTYGGHLVKFNIDHGRLMPACLPIWSWTHKLLTSAKKDSDIVLDGFCRRQEEVLIAEQALQFFERFNIHVVYLNTSKENCMKRMKGRNRKDDTEQGIMTRLEWFDWHTLPALSLLKDYRNYHFHEIDGNGTPEEVFRHISEALFSE